MAYRWGDEDRRDVRRRRWSHDDRRWAASEPDTDPGEPGARASRRVVPRARDIRPQLRLILGGIDVEVETED